MLDNAGKGTKICRQVGQKTVFFSQLILLFLIFVPVSEGRKRLLSATTGRTSGRIIIEQRLTMEHPLALFRYCPRCGSPHFEVHNGKSKHCADCGFTYYFNPSSATVALILNDREELLVCRRAKDPAKGSLDLPGGFVDMFETGEEGVIREVKEETGLEVMQADYLFSLPNLYLYSGFLVHTLDMFFRCRVADTSHFQAMDDAADAFFLPLHDIRTEDFGLDSVRKGLERFLEKRKTSL